MVALVGPLATRSREPGQARKGAAAAVTAGAEVRLAGTASLSFYTVCRAHGIEALPCIPLRFKLFRSRQSQPYPMRLCGSHALPFRGLKSAP